MRHGDRGVADPVEEVDGGGGRHDAAGGGALRVDVLENLEGTHIDLTQQKVPEERVFLVWCQPG